MRKNSRIKCYNCGITIKGRVHFVCYPDKKIICDEHWCGSCYNDCFKKGGE